MSKGGNRFDGSVPASLLAIVIVIGHASHAEAARTVEVIVEPNKGVGVGFEQILEEPQTLTIQVKAPGDWYIRSSKRRRNRGIELWTPEQNNTTAKTHTYIVEGVIPDEGHAAAFEGELTKEGEGGDPPNFDAAVADLDMDGDVLHTHRDSHWAPLDSGDSLSALEDSRE